MGSLRNFIDVICVTDFFKEIRKKINSLNCFIQSPGQRICTKRLGGSVYAMSTIAGVAFVKVPPLIFVVIKNVE